MPDNGKSLFFFLVSELLFEFLHKCPLDKGCRCEKVQKLIQHAAQFNVSLRIGKISKSQLRLEQK